MSLKEEVKDAFYTSFRTIPKAELHLHIEAVISLASIKKLYAKKNGSELSDEALEELFGYVDLNGFINAFLQVQDMFTSVDDFDLVFDDLKNYIVENGIAYCEAFFAPSAFIKKGFDFAEMMENYRKNVRLIKEATGVTVNLLMDVSRTFGLETAEHNLDLLLAHRIPEVIGIGLGGAESKGPAKEFGPVFQRARNNGLKTVAHAGEDVGPESVWDTIQILHAQRIGHGTSSFEDEKLMETLSQMRLPLEVCPTSNVFTKKYVDSIKNHPIRLFFDKKIVVTVNTDDPLFFRVSLLDEYWNLFTQGNFSKEELVQLILNSFSASFLDDGEKERLSRAASETAERVLKDIP
ncbi:MAG: adenosine deaminase [Treponema sp.]|nr:adenosine deaminase [Treponema sp.]